MDLRPLAPELILTAAGLGVLCLDMATRPEQKRVVGWGAIVGLLAALVATLLPSVGLFGRPRLVFFETYAADPFAAFFKIVVILGAMLVLLSAMEFFRGRPTPHEGDVYVLVAFMVLGLALMAGAADLILLFLAIEFVSLVSYVLAGSLKADRRSNEAGIKYFFYGSAASAVMLYGFSYLYGAGRTTNMYHLAERVAAFPESFAVVAVVLVLAGLGFKVSLVPFHQWTPDVYEGAPTPITAFLSVASKAAGFAALLRLLYVALPPQAWVAILAVLAVFSMSLGNLLALAQRNIKRMLAYSSIAHAGYILIGVVAVTGLPAPSGAGFIGSGIGAVLYYLLAYTFTNVGAFAVAIMIERALGSDAIPDYAGLSQRAPLAAFAMAIFMLSLTGVPPTALFWGKTFLFGAAIQNGFLWLAVVGILNSVVSLYYYAGVIWTMYLTPAPEGAGPVDESALTRTVLAATVAGTLVLGIYLDPFVRFAQNARLF